MPVRAAGSQALVVKRISKQQTLAVSFSMSGWLGVHLDSGISGRVHVLLCQSCLVRDIALAWHELAAPLGLSDLLCDVALGLRNDICLQVHTEEELQKILPIATKHQVPVTFRAAGTSLSGQALTDSVLLKLSHTGRNFRNYEIHVSVSAALEALTLCLCAAFYS